MVGANIQTGMDWSAISLEENRALDGTFPSREKNPDNSVLEKTVLDRYFPSGDADPSGPLDDVNAIRSNTESVEQHICYCGHCSICQSRSKENQYDDRTPDRQEVPEDAVNSLSEEEKRMVEELKQRDAEVRAHEQAHAAAGAGNVTYTFQTGPDGRQYAIGGSADMQVSAPAGDPDSKIEQARKLRTAALAPADPSPQDYAVATKADRIETEARQEKAEMEEMEKSGYDDPL